MKSNKTYPIQGNNGPQGSSNNCGSTYKECAKEYVQRNMKSRQRREMRKDSPKETADSISIQKKRKDGEQVRLTTIQQVSK